MAQFYILQRGLFALESLFLRRRCCACVSVRQHAIWAFETKWIGFTPPALPHTNASERPNWGVPPLSGVTPHRIRSDRLMDEFPQRRCNPWHHGAVCTPTRAATQPFLSRKKTACAWWQCHLHSKHEPGARGKCCNFSVLLHFSFLIPLCRGNGLRTRCEILGTEARQNQTKAQNSRFWVYHLTAKD